MLHDKHAYCFVLIFLTGVLFSSDVHAQSTGGSSGGGGGAIGDDSPSDPVTPETGGSSGGSGGAIGGDNPVEPVAPETGGGAGDSSNSVGGSAPAGQITSGGGQGGGSGAVGEVPQTPPPAPADTTPPETTALIEHAHTFSPYSHQVTLTLSATDTVPGPLTTYYSRTCKVEDYNKYTASLLFTEEGEYDVCFYSTDGAGNVEEKKNVTFTIHTLRGKLEFAQNILLSHTQYRTRGAERMLTRSLQSRFWHDRNTLTRVGSRVVPVQLRNAIRFLEHNPAFAETVEVLRYVERAL